MVDNIAMKHKSGAPRQPVLLIILDGFGCNPSRVNNGIAMARTPRFDDFFAHYPHTVLQASGKAVGLPDGQMGNSEVGHLTLGSGCIIRQDLVKIDDTITDGSFFKNEALNRAIDGARAAQRPVHLVGLVSDGGVHSHLNHLLALIELCQRRGTKPALHMITDGRDTAPNCARNYLPLLHGALERAGGTIATVSGRYYAMDRDNRWERTKKAWDAMVLREGRHAVSAEEAISIAYAEKEGDEFITPTVIRGRDAIQNNDEVIFFNFRKDRPRQLAGALLKREFKEFPRGDFAGARLTSFTCYDKWFGNPYAFEQDRPSTTLAEIISRAGLKQFHCAETEKYPHVTYFFNGSQGEAVSGEDRVIIPSPKVATYDLAPEMSAAGVADAVVDALKSEEYAFIVVNFANGDMVGHSAIPEAIIKAVECLDREVGRVIDQALQNRYSIILTADHGNCDEMVDPITGEPNTQHSVYPVPCLVIDKTHWTLSTGAGLSAIAPTVLHLMGLTTPPAMAGHSLLLKPVGHADH